MREWRISALALAVFVAIASPHGPARAGIDEAADDFGPYRPDPAQFEHGIEAYDRGDYETAFQTWLPMARGGDLAAMRNVGQMLRLGLGVEKDLPRALAFYRRAAERGLSGAQANFALMVLNGEGTQADPKEAARWFYAAAKQGHTLSSFELAKLLETGTGIEENLEGARAFYAVAATAGHQPAQERLARLEARLGVPLSAAANGTAPDPSAPGGWGLEITDGPERRSAGDRPPPLATPAPTPAPTPVRRPSPPPARQLEPPPLRGPQAVDGARLTMPPDDTPVAAGLFGDGSLLKP